jgi:hypothetical protein
MIAAARNAAPACSPAEQPLPLALSIACRLKDRYAWVDMEEIPSYSVPGLVLAARTDSPDRDVSFACFAGSKTMVLTVDQMRRNEVLSRACRHRWPFLPMGGGDCAEGKGQAFGIVDRRSDVVMARMEACDTLGRAFPGPAPEDRRLPLLHYAEGLTFLDIARILDLPGSAISPGHTRLRPALRSRWRPAETQ